MNKKERVINIIRRLEKIFSNKTSLKYETPFQILVSTILSAQCRDSVVNKVTEKIYEEFKEPKDFAQLSIEELDDKIKSINFHLNKSKNILKCAKEILTNHNGQIPNNMNDLLMLPGIGRKTSNLILGEVYKIIQGIVVDTHVKRITKRIGLTQNLLPDKIENDLKKIVDKSEWINFSHLIIYHGRKTCIARYPKCYECPIVDLCLYKSKDP